VNTKEKDILRDTALRVKEISELSSQAEKIRLWKKCNDLEPARAMIFADPQNGWAELDQAWMQLECESGPARRWEHQLKRKLLRHEHINDDFPILAELKVPLPVSGLSYDDYGLELETTKTDDQGGAYHIEPVIKEKADMQKLHFRRINVDRELAEQEREMALEVFDGIINVRQTGIDYWRYGLTRVLIHMRGLENLMIDMYDDPELLKDLAAFLRDDFLRELETLSAEKAFSLNNHADTVLGSGGLAFSSALPEAVTGEPTGFDQCWCWCEAQEAVSISPEMFEEFIFAYQLPLMNNFGLVDYGCCEPLENKLDILIKNIPHLRWLSISPWADKAQCHEKIQDKYVYVYKPHPADICSPTVCWDSAGKDIEDALSIRGNAPMHIVMKDTSTFHSQPERITEWAEMARSLVL
jgi:hypothetical protein